MGKILVIDDERPIRRTLCEILEFEKFEVDQAKNGEEGLKMARDNEYDVILCDIKMPKMDGMEVLEKIKELDYDSTIVMISGHGTIDTAVDALKKGAFDYLPKPPDLNRLLVTVRNAMNKKELVQETKVLKKKLNKVKSGNIIGESQAIKTVINIIDKVAATDARVLITGGNGSGKELVARQIHEKSPRAKSSLVEVNCAAIPSELIESELFGHEKGAFTSAHKQRKGNFESANGGTLFLDEIGDMSLSAQAKVLRALQENKITRVGGEKEIKVDVRVVAATNKDLKEEIANGRFREDLYHRLSVIIIENPSLNQRKEDIPLLSDFFTKQICEEHGIAPKIVSKEGLNELQKINWTGNIREFRNVMERLIILCGNEITQQDVIAFARPLSQH
ncbi:MAG: response regulator [Flavobacteriales bacterium]|nr:response regulator [Flavobacteriales bacterium]|tara:strand:- start:1126 stop:2301 length:1176 start_codon:yes stop_codon:yes gene_type:complete